MKTTNLNTIVERQNAEAKAAEEARKATEERALIEAAQPKTILDMLQDVYDEKLLIITDEDNNIVGINCPIKADGMQVTQKVGCNVVMGSDETHMHEDYIELQKFMRSYNGQNCKRLFEICLMLKTANLHPVYAEQIRGTYYFVVLETKKVIDENGNTIVDAAEVLPEEVLTCLNAEALKVVLIDKLHLVKSC